MSRGEHADPPEDPVDPGDATQLMNAAAAGDRQAGDRLLELVYDELRGHAQLQLAGERAGHTLSATALVHEAYLRLTGPRKRPWAGRGHFFAAAAQAMRRILVDHARSRAVRGPGRVSLTEIGDLGTLAGAGSETILAVDEAISRLERDDPEAAELVRLRFFAGLGVQEAAEILEISPRSAARLWAYARAVLFKQLSQE